MFGYVLQIGLINPFIRRAEHTQFLPLVALGLIIANGLSDIFGPDARSVQTSYALDSIQIGPLIVDTTKVYAGLAAIAFTVALFVFFRFTLVGKAYPRLRPQLHRRASRRARRANAFYRLTFGLGAACVGAAGTMLTLLIDATPMLGPSYTLLAFVIVITGGLGLECPARSLAAFWSASPRRWLASCSRLRPKTCSPSEFVLVLLFRPQGLLGKRGSYDGALER